MGTITPELKRDIQGFLNSLEKGTIEINHTMRLLLWRIDDQNVEGVAAVLPASVLEELKKLIPAMPHSDAEWEKYIDVALLTACFDHQLPKSR
jgi:hypothetical protein